MSKLWLVNIEFVAFDENEIKVIPTYRMFDGVHHLFKRNGDAVDFVRKIAKKNKLREVWIDPSWDKEKCLRTGEFLESIDYICFVDQDKNDYRIYFELLNINERI